jgi:hypothetical protein
MIPRIDVIAAGLWQHQATQAVAPNWPFSRRKLMDGLSSLCPPSTCLGKIQLGKGSIRIIYFFLFLANLQSTLQIEQ